VAFPKRRKCCQAACKIFALPSVHKFNARCQRADYRNDNESLEGLSAVRGGKLTSTAPLKAKQGLPKRAARMALTLKVKLSF
jgi:hypothetical protein